MCSLLNCGRARLSRPGIHVSSRSHKQHPRSRQSWIPRLRWHLLRRRIWRICKEAHLSILGTIGTRILPSSLGTLRPISGRISQHIPRSLGWGIDLAKLEGCLQPSAVWNRPYTQTGIQGSNRPLSGETSGRIWVVLDVMIIAKTPHQQVVKSVSVKLFRQRANTTYIPLTYKLCSAHRSSASPP